MPAGIEKHGRQDFQPTPEQGSLGIAANIDKPLLIGPDSESAQWVEAVAERAGAPCTVLKKTRRGDRDIGISAPIKRPLRP